jgi:hypothetical protein
MLLDFDAAWAQQTDPPLPIKVLGVVHDLPSSMPAGVRLHMWRVRMDRGEDAPLSYGDLEVVARFLFGTEVVDGWLAERMMESQLRDVVLSTIAAYSAREPGRAEGNPPGASGAPPT